MDTSLANQLTLRQQLIREAGSLNNPELLAEALAFVQQLHGRDSEPPPGSPAAVMRFFGTLSPAEADEMQAVINREFNNMQGDVVKRREAASESA